MRFIGRRVLHLAIVLLLVTLATSFLLDLTPGDPALAIIGETATADQIAVVHHQLGLDRPFVSRYISWITKAAHGDLGVSYRTKQPVWQAIHERLPVTLELAVLTIFFSLLIAIPLGVITAYKQGGAIDRIVGGVLAAFFSSPPFLTALVFVFFLAVTHHIFPVTGWIPLSKSVCCGQNSNLRHAFLPVASLVVLEAAVFSRLLRSDMITTLQEDYVLAARAKGLPTWQILVRHALRPSSFTLMTVAGLSLGRVLGGTVIVEQLFALPGIGLYIINAIYNKDLIAVQGAVLFIATAYVLVNAIVEVSYAWLDPRVRVTV